MFLHELLPAGREDEVDVFLRRARGGPVRDEEERARHEQPQPQLELPVDRPRPRTPAATPEEGERGVIIVELL